MMDYMNLPLLLRLARDTVADPREGAQYILANRPVRPALWLMFAIVVVGSLLLGEVVALMVTLPEGGVLTGPFQRAPIVLGLMQAAFLFLMVHAITWIGRMFGGTGEFEEALALVIWLQFIFLCVQLVQIVTLLLLPPLSGIVTILALGLFFWLLVNFIAALHGFASLGAVFGMTVVSFITIVFVLSLVLSILGLMPNAGDIP